MIFRRFAFFSVLFSGAVVFSALTGCSTLASRSREKAETWQSLDAGTQQRLKQQQINIGDTADMVYVALGAPSHKQENTTGAGHSEVWIYVSSWQEFRGMAFAGYRREIVPDGRGGQRVIYISEEVPVYEQRSEERLRVTLTDGKVTLIEQAKDPRR